jgi:hypothetical protein
MSEAVARTVEALDPESDPLLSASVELARAYARQLDQAGAMRAAADKALRAAEESGDETLIEQVTALRAKCGERDAVVQVGAKLHALLAELLATPKARGARPSGAAGGALQKLRAVK